MVSSRLARREQKKYLRQTIIWAVAAVVLLILFITVVMPTFLRLVANMGGGATSNDPDDTLPPQIPALSAPPTATFSAEVKLSGFGEAESELVILNNTTEQTRQKIGSDGKFEVILPLNEGENSVTAYAIDGAGNESNISRTYPITRDSEAPKLQIDEPQPGQQIETRKNQVMTIKGVTEENARVSVNGRTVLARADGAFSTTYQLSEGENKLELIATDAAGNTTRQELTVNFRF